MVSLKEMIVSWDPPPSHPTPTPARNYKHLHLQPQVGFWLAKSSVLTTSRGKEEGKRRKPVRMWAEPPLMGRRREQEERAH